MASRYPPNARTSRTSPSSSRSAANGGPPTRLPFPFTDLIAAQLRGQRGLHLASIILAEVFAHNQHEFTKAEPRTVPCIAVVEEAQAVLAPSATSAEDSPFVSWVKEGRKYGLGAVLVTQQPGSIPSELLSQGDNFFVFHLLSAGDLGALKRANAHFSDDLLATLLNEPLVGHGVAWGTVQSWLAQAAPPEDVVGNRFQWARAVVRPALLAILGPEGSGWRTETRHHPERSGASQTWIFLTDTVEEVEHATPPEEQP